MKRILMLKDILTIEKNLPGPYSPVVLGDYSCGLNHILPTSSASKHTGGLSVGAFLKIQNLLQTNKHGFFKVAPAAKCLAETEGLEGHKYSLSARKDK